MSSHPIILFEPICRGSRLQILANTISGIRSQSDRPIKIVTRSDYMSTHVSELLGVDLLNVEFIAANTDLDGQWIKTLTKVEMLAMLVALQKAVDLYQSSDIVFLALDEYLKSLLPHITLLRQKFSSNRFFILKYRVEYMLPESKKSVRSFSLNMLTRWVIWRLRAQLVCFDERFNQTRIAGKLVATLPDPWFGAFSPLLRNMARNKFGFSDSEFVVLTLGRQDRRKGFPLILQVLPSLLVNRDFRFFVVGKIETEFLENFDTLKKQFSNQVVHIERFIDESELPEVFASADVFLLPYSIDFTSSSGTLPRAAASGVPVISGTHGLVGHRIKSLGLGEVFDINEPASLNECINAVRSYTQAKKHIVSQALASFSKSTHIKIFEQAISKVFL